MEVTAVVALATSAATTYLAKKNIDVQKKQMKAERRAAKRQYDLDVAQRKLTLEEEQRKNRNLLAQQQATYRARLGAAGMSSRSGSGQAVLDTLQREHDTEDKYLVNQANISLEALLNGINARNARNLLAQSQLENRYAANMSNALNTLTASAGRSVIK